MIVCEQTHVGLLWGNYWMQKARWLHRLMDTSMLQYDRAFRKTVWVLRVLVCRIAVAKLLDAQSHEDGYTKWCTSPAWQCKEPIGSSIAYRGQTTGCKMPKMEYRQKMCTEKGLISETFWNIHKNWWPSVCSVAVGKLMDATTRVCWAMHIRLLWGVNKMQQQPIAVVIPNAV